MAEKLVIIENGGLKGMLTALFAAQLKDAAGQPYDITLLETGEHLAQGSAKAFYHLDLGGAFPHDPKTAKKCLNTGALWKLIFRTVNPHRDIFTEEAPMNMLLPKTHDDQAMRYETHAQMLTKEYQSLLTEVKGIPDLTHNKMLPYQMEEALFGAPENFIRKQEELRFYNGKIKAGFKTQEPGIDLPRFLAALEGALQHCPNITIKTGQQILEIPENSVKCDDGSIYPADYIVLPEKTEAERRVMARVDMSNVPWDAVPPSSLVAGTMFRPINESLAIVSQPGQEGLFTRVPAYYKEKLVKGAFPFLKNAEFEQCYYVDADNGTLALQDAIAEIQRITGRKKDPLRAVLEDSEFDIAPLLHMENKKQFVKFMLKHIEIPRDAVGRNKAIRREYKKAFEGFQDSEQTEKVQNIPKRDYFGIGFGEEIKLDVDEKNGPKTGLIFNPDPELNKDACNKIAQWNLDGAPCPLTEKIDLHELAKGVANHLTHMDLLELIKIMRSVAADIPPESRKLLFHRDNVKLYPRPQWDLMRQARLTLPPYHQMLEQQERVGEPGYPDLPGRVAETAAVMLPTLFAQLSDEHKAIVTGGMAHALHVAGLDKQFFAPLADPDLNIVKIHDVPGPRPVKSIINTGRAIKIISQEPDMSNPSRLYVDFQGDRFEAFEFHVHLKDIKNEKGEPEDDQEYWRVNNRPRVGKNPNDKVKGELHGIFKSLKTKRALSLNSYITLGRPNTALQPPIDALTNRHGPLMTENPILNPDVRFDPIPCYNRGKFEEAGLPESPFCSLNLGSIAYNQSGEPYIIEGSSETFYRGVGVVHMLDKKSLTVDETQLAALRAAQPPLKIMPPEGDVGPMARVVVTAPSGHKRG